MVPQQVSFVERLSLSQRVPYRGSTVWHNSIETDKLTLNYLCVIHCTQLRELEKERIAELGSSVGKQQDVEPDRRRRMASRAGDLMSSAQLEKPLASVRRSRESKGDYGT